MTTRRALIRRIEQALTPLYESCEARSIARLCLSELGGVPLEALLSDPEAPIEIEGIDTVIERLQAGEPVQYVVGATEFLGRRFAVRKGVLIPRPETEELVSRVIARERLSRRLLDVGTGSGCIAATLALELPDAGIFAADISDEALAVAAENCRTLGARVTLRRADALRNLTERFPERFDAIVSNPPYVPERDRAAMHLNVLQYEPAEALFVPNDDPLLFYRAIARAGRQLLLPGGRLHFEIYYKAGEALRAMLQEEGYDVPDLFEDLNGKPRILCARLR